MKKLFFAALVATVAVGGALSTNAQNAQGASRVYDCLTGSDILCSAIPETTVNILPSGPNGVNPAEFYLESPQQYSFE